VIANAKVSPEIVFVVAVAENGVIGSRGALPWRLKSDLKRFKAMTIGRPVVMGRKTFASIGRPLPGRTNIVVTRDSSFRARGVVMTTSLAEARAIARGDALRHSATEIAVIGGAEIYSQWMDVADRLEITPIDAAAWKEVSRVRHAAAGDDSADFSYVTYRRRKSN
jgi:dihydrofolate reductase